MPLRKFFLLTYIWHLCAPPSVFLFSVARKVPVETAFLHHLLEFVISGPASEASLASPAREPHPEGAGESAVCPSPSRLGTWHHLTPSEGVAKSRQFPTPSEGVDGPFPAHAICRPCRIVFLEVRHYTPSEGVAKSRQFPTPLEGVNGPFPAHAICRPCRTVFLEVRHYTPSEGVAKSRQFPTPSEGVDGSEGVELKRWGMQAFR